MTSKENTSDAAGVRKQTIGRLIFLVALALLLRFLAFPLTSVTNEGDSVPRIFLSWQWLEHPALLDCSGWPPLHFYMIAAALWIWFDPVRSPSVLHILISIATAIPLWGFVRREWGEKGALFVAAAFLFYPLAWHLSFMPASEGAFAFFVASAMYFLSRTRSSAKTIDAACAGILMTLAAAIRMEGWALIPVFAVVLYGRWKSLFTYLFFAALFPVFCATQNMMQGIHPISYFANFQQWELKYEAINEGRDAWEILRRIVYYPLIVFFGLTPPVAIFSGIGCHRVWKDRIKRIWLFPPSAMLLIFIVQVVRGLGGTTARFSLSLGVLFLPFAGATIEMFAGRAWLKSVAVLSIALMIPLSYSRIILYRIAGPDFPNPFPADIQAIPRIQKDSKEIARIAEQNLTGKNDGLLIDFFGKDFYPWKDTYAVALLSHASPPQIFFMPGGRYQPLNNDALGDFLISHPSGVLLFEKNSRMIHMESTENPAIFRVGEFRLTGRPLKSIRSITIYRYKIL